MFLNPADNNKTTTNGTDIEMCFPTATINGVYNNGNDVVVGGNNVDIMNLDIVSRFSLPVCTRESSVREAALDTMERTVERWMEGYGSPTHRDTAATTTNGFSTTNSSLSTSPQQQDYLALVAMHTPALLRLSVSCPFSDVRDKCNHILRIVSVSILIFYYMYILKIGYNIKNAKHKTKF